MDHKRKNSKSLLALAVLSEALAISGFLRDILDFKIAVPAQWKFPIFFIFTAIAIFLTYWALKEKPANNTAPVNLPTGSNIFEYMSADHVMPHNNPVHIHVCKFALSLMASLETSIIGQTLVDQKVHWTFEGKNVQQPPLTYFIMTISLSAFTSWEDGAISFSASLKKHDGVVHTIVDYHVIEVPGQPDIRQIQFIFPDNIQCGYAEPFIFDVTMTWTRGCHFQDTARYFSDPKNYGTHVEKLILEVATNMPELMNRDFRLYRMRRSNQEMELCASPNIPYFLPEKVFQWEVTPDIEHLYIIDIRNNIQE